MRINKDSLSYLLLDVLGRSVDTAVRLEDFAYKSHMYAFGDRWHQSIPKSALSKAIGRLKRGGLIEEVRVDGNLVIKLTGNGKEFMGELFDREQKWDGKWRIVIFDIPESKRLIRDLFRRNLKRWGFKQMQKSVWVSRRDVFEKLEVYIQELGIGGWVTVIEAERLTSAP